MLSAIQQWGIEFILALQSLSIPGVDTFFYLVTQLGGFAYLLVVPLVIWCIEPRLGLRALLAMMLAQYVVMLIKDIVQEPRPFQVDTRIVSDGEHGYSFPSGHAMGSLVYYGLLLLATPRRWLKRLLAALIVLIGLSRNYLGVHYPHDVLVGWVLGLLFLWAWLRWQRPIQQWFSAQRDMVQVTSCLTVPLIIGIAHWQWFDYAPALTVAGAVSASLLSLMQLPRLPFVATGPLWQRTLRYLVGLPILFAALSALGKVYPEQDSWLSAPLAWANGAVLVGLAGLVLPRLLIAVRLARHPAGEH